MINMSVWGMQILLKLYPEDNPISSYSQISENFSRGSTSVIPVWNETHLNLLHNWTFQNSHEFTNTHIITEIMVISFYTLLILVAIFGNLMVCQVVFRYPAIKCSTNKFIGNLSISDLLMSIYSLPLNVARMLMDNWTLGRFLCSSSTFIQQVSVYVSTLTMTCIAFDRCQVISTPLKSRLRNNFVKWKIACIWICAIFLSSPYALFTDVVEIFTFRKLLRCQIIYPEPSALFRMWGTIAVVITQYVIPLSITAVLYAKIVYIMWYRKIIGAVTENQRIFRKQGKWKTIKILMLIVAVFAICWLPMNMYNLYMDCTTDSPYKRKPNIFLICQCIAMSSICYNPFIYCWFNKSFRTFAISHASYFQKTFNRCCPSNHAHSPISRRNWRLCYRLGTNRSALESIRSRKISRTAFSTTSPKYLKPMATPIRIRRGSHLAQPTPNATSDKFEMSSRVDKRELRASVEYNKNSHQNNETVTSV